MCLKLIKILFKIFKSKYIDTFCNVVLTIIALLTMIWAQKTFGYDNKIIELKNIQNQLITYKIEAKSHYYNLINYYNIKKQLANSKTPEKTKDIIITLYNLTNNKYEKKNITTIESIFNDYSNKMTINNQNIKSIENNILNDLNCSAYIKNKNLTKLFNELKQELEKYTTQADINIFNDYNIYCLSGSLNMFDPVLSKFIELEKKINSEKKF